LDNLIGLIKEYYGLTPLSYKQIEGQFCDIYIMDTGSDKYVVKSLPEQFAPCMEQEGHLTKYLFDSDIKVARVLKTRDEKYHVKTDDELFHVQEYIDGIHWKPNTAPDWLVASIADMLGEIHHALKDYPTLHSGMGDDYLNRGILDWAMKHYTYDAERMAHLKRISQFDIDKNKLTYSNSHGDFHIGQIITQGQNLTAIDWTSASRIPICYEVINSYVFASPESKDGAISIEGLKRHIDRYLKHFTLNDYDIAMMPYVLYFQNMIMHYSPPYDDIPSAYQPICDFLCKLTTWLYNHVDELAHALL
jgi:Ser/Thr protein kinase RdoA (MazF antagonist)